MHNLCLSLLNSQPDFKLLGLLIENNILNSEILSKYKFED